MVEAGRRIGFRVDPASDGFFNMRADEALLEAAESGVSGCRVYSWRSVWITLGKFQDPKRDLAPDCPIPWITRPTGGKAVLHGHDWTVGFAMPLPLLAETADVDPDALARSLKHVYRLMAAPLIQALRRSGLPAILGEDTRFVGKGPRVADCFAHVSANDIVHEHTGKKVCGCALKLTRSAVLVQASIPKALPSIDPARVIAGAKSAGLARWQDADFPRSLEESMATMGADRP